jgi:nitroreductase
MRRRQSVTSRRQLLRNGMTLGSGLLAAAALPRRAAGEPASTPSTASAENETLKTIHDLRTTHGDFSSKQVPDKTIQTILDASVRAASASAMQSYSIVVVRDGPTIGKLTGYPGSCLLLYCLDYTRLVDCASELGYRYAPGSMEAFVTGSTNTILAAQTAVIAARSLGVDSLLTNGIHRGDMQRVWDTLGLPEQHCFPLIALILGYAVKEPAYRKGRLRGPGVVHRDRYQRLDKAQVEELVRQYDDKANHLGLVEDWDQKGHKHYLDWLYKDWLRVADPSPATATETSIMKFVRKSGFVEGQKS